MAWIYHVLILVLNIFSPIQEPAVALESTATITPCWNLKARVVVPWANLIRTPPSPDAKGFRNSTGYITKSVSAGTQFCYSNWRSLSKYCPPLLQVVQQRTPAHWPEEVDLSRDFPAGHSDGVSPPIWGSRRGKERSISLQESTSCLQLQSCWIFLTRPFVAKLTLSSLS